MTSRTNNRAANAARNEILETLKEDHKRVKKAYREFTKLDREAEPERCEELVRQVLADLELHTALEEEFLYPAAREAIAQPDLVDEAEVEHESAKALIEQLNAMESDDEKFAARFTVLCEYVMHHVKEEETELFPQLQNARLDWENIAREMTERRNEMAPAEETEGEMAGEDSEAGAQQQSKGKSGGRSRGGREAGADTQAKAGEPAAIRRN